MKAKPHDDYIANAEIALTLIDHLDAMLAYWDINQVCLFANNAYQDWFGKAKEKVIGKTLQELLGPLYLKNLPYILAAYEGQTQVFELEIRTPDGRTRYSLATYTPHIIGNQVQGIFVHVADVTPLKKLEWELQAARAKAEHLATHDYLTGLPNRTLLLDQLTQLLALAQHEHNMVAVLSADIDNFKEVNDTYGHGEGDRLLIEIASRMKNSFRESDTPTRLGGDEFLILVSEIKSSTQVKNLAARLLKSVSQPFQLKDAILSPTLSIGIALYPRHGTTPEELIANSDRALYLAKKLGKNCYTLVSQG